MKFWAVCAVKMLLILAVGQALAAQSRPENAGGEKKEQPTAKILDPASESRYRIGPQDVLLVDVWKEQEVSRQVTVRPDGMISLPLLNDVQASGMTAMQLGQIIREQLKSYITEPQVTITVMEINSRRVFVTGEVQRSGAFPLLPNMTVLQALSSCGGFTQFANTKKIYILRVEDGKQVKIPVNYKALVKGSKPEENVKLQAGDTIVVP
jgi:polysaccharide biosynthesis/export protein